MDDFNLLELFDMEPDMATVVSAHELLDNEPHYEEPSQTLYQPLVSPFASYHDSYTCY